MTSSTSWLPAALRWLFTVFVVFTMIGTVVVMAVILIDPSLPLQIHGTHFVVQAPGMPTVDLEAQNGDIRVALSAFKGQIQLHIDHGGDFFDVLKHYGLPLILLNALFFTLLFDLLRRLFRNVGRGESFTPQTLRLVQIVGVSLLGFSLAAAAAEGWFDNAILSYLAGHTVLSVSGSVLQIPKPEGFTMAGGDFPFGTPFFFSGLLVLAMSEVFRQGLMLKRENDLTV